MNSGPVSLDVLGIRCEALGRANRGLDDDIVEENLVRRHDKRGGRIAAINEEIAALVIPSRLQTKALRTFILRSCGRPSY